MPAPAAAPRTSATRGIVIYGIGHIGQLVTRLVQRQGWRLAAAINRPGPKIGRDLGTLAGLPAPIGLTVELPDTVDLRTLAADVAIVSVADRLSVMLPIYRRLLEQGLNIISCDCEASYPWGADAALAEEIDAIAKANGVTFTGTGLPDAFRIWLPRVLTGACDSLRGYRHESTVDIGRHGAQSCRLAHVGSSTAAFARSTAAGGGVSIYRLFLQQAVVALGLDITAMRESLEPVTASEPIRCEALDLVVPAGDCIGTRFLTEIDTAQGIQASGASELRLLRPGEVERMLFLIEGSSPLRAEITGFDSDLATAAQMIARIPDVIAAPPGIVTIDRLGPPTYPV